jgi:predicted nucleic acid-binding Zn ribbon protein
MSRRGYAQAVGNQQLQASLVQAVGQPLATAVRVGKLNNGVLTVLAADSVTMQELTFQKQQILQRLQSSTPQSSITEVKFKVHAFH